MIFDELIKNHAIEQDFTTLTRRIEEYHCAFEWCFSGGRRVWGSTPSVDGRQHGESATSGDEATCGWPRRLSDVREESKDQLHVRTAASSATVLRRLPVHRRQSKSQDLNRSGTHRDPSKVHLINDSKQNIRSKTRQYRRSYSSRATKFSARHLSTSEGFSTRPNWRSGAIKGWKKLFSPSIFMLQAFDLEEPLRNLTGWGHGARLRISRVVVLSTGSSEPSFCTSPCSAPKPFTWS